MNILVIGGSGFIGSYLLKKLVDQNHNVTNFDLDKINIDSVRSIKGDIRLKTDLSDRLNESFDCVYILAPIHRDDVKDSSTLICRKPSANDIEKYVEEELLDGLCCYSAVNQGQLNQTIVDAVIHHLQKEKIPTVPRSIRHKYMSGFLLAATAFTEMDKVVLIHFCKCCSCQ